MAAAGVLMSFDTCGTVSLSEANIIMTVVLVSLSSYVLWRVHQGYARRKRLAEHGATDTNPAGSVLVFPIYYVFLKVAIALYVGRAIALSVTTTTDTHMSLFPVLVLHPMGAMVSEGMVFFLAQKGAGRLALRRTYTFTVLWGLLIAAVGLASWIVDSDSGSVHNFVPEGAAFYWYFIDGLRIVFYTGVIVYCRVTHHPRKAVYGYAVFELVIYSLSLAFDLIFEVHASADVGECSIFVVWMTWTLVWPHLILYTLRTDSEYWRGGGVMWESGSDSFVDARKPLLEHEVVIDATYGSDGGGGGGVGGGGAGGGGGGGGGTGGVPFGHRRSQVEASNGDLLPMMGAHVAAPASFMINFEELAFGQLVGEGGTASVYRGLHRGHHVAVKQFNCELLTPANARKFAQEMSFAANLHHPNLVRSIGVCVVPPAICLVTEFMHRGSLFHVIGAYPRMPALRRVSLAADTARALAFLHAQRPPVLHRDLKSLNLLVDRDWCLKVADFGEARELAMSAVGMPHAASSPDAAGLAQMTIQRGTPQWMAPELFHTGCYTEKIDVYSLGVVMWELASGRRPFDGVNPWLVPARVCENGERPNINAALHVPRRMVSLIEECWSPDPGTRPSAAGALRVLEDIIEDLVQGGDGNGGVGGGGAAEPALRARGEAQLLQAAAPSRGRPPRRLSH